MKVIIHLSNTIQLHQSLPDGPIHLIYQTDSSHQMLMLHPTSSATWALPTVKDMSMLLPVLRLTCNGLLGLNLTTVLFLVCLSQPYIYLFT